MKHNFRRNQLISSAGVAAFSLVLIVLCLNDGWKEEKELELKGSVTNIEESIISANYSEAEKEIKEVREKLVALRQLQAIHDSFKTITSILMMGCAFGSLYFTIKIKQGNQQAEPVDWSNG
jgi:hypothetical protein